MKHNISVREAHAIAGERPSQIPVEYEQAVAALSACCSIDEAKTWSDKADALAAWAKIYRSRDADRQARRLRLHAYRRMGILAGELRPRIPLGKRLGSTKGPRSLLVEQGLSAANSKAARRLANLSPEAFAALIDQPRPPAPVMVDRQLIDSSDMMKALRSNGGMAPFLSFARRFAPTDVARGMAADEAIHVRRMIHELSDWLDELDRQLQREAPAGDPSAR